MNALRAWLGLLLRTALTVLLLTTSVTPALAEIGCFEDSVSHQQLQARAGTADVISSDQGSPSDDSDQAGTGHCAFAHGHCGFVAPSAAPAARMFAVPSAPFLPRAARHLVTAARDGLERPPQA